MGGIIAPHQVPLQDNLAVWDTACGNHLPVRFGWQREKLGYVLDAERGYWAKNDQEVLDDPDDPMSALKERVIPYVEDRRNALLFEPKEMPDEKVMASLAAASQDTRGS